MLEIKKLQASINNKPILKGLNLTIKSGELHAIMGPNGSGKSTLANVLSGKNGYEISGEINFKGENLKKIPVDERARKGIFLAFQYPLEIPGVKKNVYSVYVTYSAGGDTNIEADLIYRHSTGETTVAMQEASGSTYYDDSVGFKTTSGAKATIELVPSAAVKNANSFQFKIANPDATHDVSDDFRLYSISFRYRTKGVR